ncbi:hypothetical protein [Streptomyces sp. NPDC006551]|uniref:hypothetical protein n=1 Tax=Streptomyces sp. NPDC006551 TaxID=3157178 RepID=UPI0033A9C4AF
MHADIHLELHRLRAADLEHRVACTPPHTPLRTRLGWTMVEVGLKLAIPSTARPTALAA